ncbi:MAG: hypothetical protein KGJ24_10835 [Burkholderiales bacterium]|nr:hypothetical protein [Burkholderiales bacterium]MDE2564661.1 hypothetical protein [Burkholderiales bacterium]
MPQPPPLPAPGPTADPAPSAPTLAEQHAEFTADGSPPPGHVATGRPALEPLPAPAPPPPRAKLKLKRASRARYP